MDHDLVWGIAWFMRRNAIWTGNGFEFEVQEIKFSMQRRGYNDSYLTRGDHAWKIIILNLPIIPPDTSAFIAMTRLHGISIWKNIFNLRKTILNTKNVFVNHFTLNNSMFSMRYFVNLMDSAIMDSYEDDSNSEEAKRIETNMNLSIKGFEEENKQLESEYIIEDPKVQSAVKHYTHASSINEELIRVDGVPGRLPEDFRNEYDLLISLKGTPLGEEHHTYCGTGTFNPMEVTVGGIFKTPAFLSTSLSVRVAVKTTNHRREQAHNVEDHVLHFVLPEGFTGGFYIAPYSSDPEELEFLLFPKEHFRHLGSKVIELDGIKRHIHSFRPS
jgi:hypothetical protein